MVYQHSCAAFMTVVGLTVITSIVIIVPPVAMFFTDIYCFAAGICGLATSEF